MVFQVIQVGNQMINTTVTASGHTVSIWINTIRNIYLPPANSVVVGLDVKWRPHGQHGTGVNPIASLQLCIGNHCLVFHLIHCNNIPEELRYFLADRRFLFVGMRIRNVSARLNNDYGFVLGNIQDLAETAALRTRQQLMLYMTLDDLVLELLTMCRENMRSVRLSNWANHGLNRGQIECATADAFLTYIVGMVLNS